MDFPAVEKDECTSWTAMTPFAAPTFPCKHGQLISKNYTSAAIIL